MRTILKYVLISIIILFQRRLSDPSANITNFVRGGWRTREPKDKSRSENEGLDALVDGLAEVEAGDLRDGTSHLCLEHSRCLVENL